MQGVIPGLCSKSLKGKFLLREIALLKTFPNPSLGLVQGYLGFGFRVAPWCLT